MIGSSVPTPYLLYFDPVEFKINTTIICVVNGLFFGQLNNHGGILWLIIELRLPSSLHCKGLRRQLERSCLSYCVGPLMTRLWSVDRETIARYGRSYIKQL